MTPPRDGASEERPVADPAGRRVPAAAPPLGAGGPSGLDATVPRYPRRFRWRVILNIMLVSLVAAGVAFGYSYLRQAEFQREDRHARGRILGETLAESSDTGLLSEDAALLMGPLARIMEAPDVIFVEVYRVDGARLAERSRGSAAGSGAPPQEIVSEILRATAPMTVVRGGVEKDEYFSPVMVPDGDAVLAAFGSTVQGPIPHRAVGYVRVAISHAQQQERQRKTLLWSIYLAAGLLLLGFLLALLVGWRLSGPILRLAEGADAIGQGNLDVQVSIRSHDELGQLADSFNRMVWKLKSTVAELADLNRNLESQVAERTQDVRAMAGFLEILNARRELHALVRDALRALVQDSGGAIGAIYLYNDQATSLSLQVSQGVPPEAFGAQTVKLAEGPVGIAALESDAVVITDPAKMDRLSRTLGETLHTVLYQRIRFGESLAGVLVVGSCQEISQAPREALERATHPLAIAIANARAFEAAERLARELEARNVDLLRQTELLAEQKAKLEEMNRLKSELMANITHELRTPLNAVIGYAELMHGGAYGELTAEQFENTGAIVESARGLLDLITQILDMAKMEAGQMGLVISEADISALLREAAHTAQVLGRGRPIRVGLGLPKGRLLLRTDESKLKQIVTNLVSNAIKFTEEGRVDLLATQDPNGSLRILVRDTGIGIAAEHQDVVFAEFWQVDGSTTRRSMGTGLGLAISRKFAVLMGGSLTVESTLGVGSTFTLRLPARPPSVAVDADSEAGRLDDVSQALGLSRRAEAPGLKGGGQDLAGIAGSITLLDRGLTEEDT